MNTLKTPGVKVKEVSLLPPSIAQVSTAIPVFLGYTELGDINIPVRITSLTEYEQTFGTGYAYKYDITPATTNTSADLNVQTDFPTFGTFFLYEAIRLYFLNGGGACYVLPIGNHPTIALTTAYITATDFTNSLPEIERLDEPTIIVFPEAVNLTTGYGNVASQAINIASNLADKFVLIDSANDYILSDHTTATTYRNQLTSAPQNLSYGAAYYPHLETLLSYTIDETESEYGGQKLSLITATANYGIALDILNQENKVIIPPSALMAGVYAKSDRDNGFWKAPANIPLQGVIQPVEAISDNAQMNLNVDVNNGKSINVIRSFSGKGTLVWGARTLAGNSLEWKYIPVRRSFMTIEESVKKAISQFVFENNDAQTWNKVSSMIQSYLNDLWQDGALTGASAKEAYFVQVGLGTTMTQNDILEGKMIVKVGLAAVRPAEFIVLEFSHFISQ